MITKPYNSLLFTASLTLAGCQTVTTAPSQDIPQHENIMTMQANIPDSDEDGVPDDIDECPKTPPTRVLDAKGCLVVVEVGGLEMSFAGFFPPMSSQLPDVYDKEFAIIEENLNAYPKAKVFIFGHTASSERDEEAIMNFGIDMLARNRALIVKNKLILDHSIAPDRIHTYDCSIRYLATEQDSVDRTFAALNVDDIEAKQSRFTLMASSEVHDLNNFKYISYEQLYGKYAQKCTPFT
ncbi:OmpA family protein [Psychrobacter sp. 1176_08]|uniref:hypothetical protein n=1 Tax=Psychrobacter sp. 1176_08 TaxID=2604452 RepID=UPI0040632FF6